MNIKRYDYKVSFLDKIFSAYPLDQPLHILDMGSGTSQNFYELLYKYPNVHYTAVEFNQGGLTKARSRLADRGDVQFINAFGEEMEARYRGHFDITLSLSVLEHVKFLETFLKSSAKMTKKGGLVIHRYDLGHALHPSGPLERLKVLVSSKLPFLIPSRHFTTYPQIEFIVAVLEKNDVYICDIYQSQIPNLKYFMNKLDWNDKEAIRISSMIFELEQAIYQYFDHKLKKSEMDMLFPSVTIIGKKA